MFLSPTIEHGCLEFAKTEDHVDIFCMNVSLPQDGELYTHATIKQILTHLYISLQLQVSSREIQQLDSEAIFVHIYQHHCFYHPACEISL